MSAPLEKQLAGAAASLLASDWEDQDYDRLVADGAAIDRLLSGSPKSGDFARYQARMASELALVMRKSLEADSEQARCTIQGAMLQQLRVMKLPADLVAKAARAVERRREEPDEG